MEIKLDENDLKILDILSREPRASISKISKETGLSRPTVHSRIEKILKSGVLKGLHFELDEAELGGKVFLVSLSSEKPQETVEELVKLPQVDEIFITSGLPNIHVILYVFDLESLSRFLEYVSKTDSQAKISLVFTRCKLDRTTEKLVAAKKAILHCETCGVSISGTPYIYVYKNRKHYFCCPVCRNQFVDKVVKSVQAPKS